jgi:hypothetical protein
MQYRSQPGFTQAALNQFLEAAEKEPQFCHSERSEEWLGLIPKAIPRFARKDEMG